MPDAGERPTPPRRPRRPAVVAAILVVGLYVLAVDPFIIRGGGLPRATDDEKTYHLPTIEQFARQWPRPDVSDYPSAATPGYYLALAPVRRFFSADVRRLRLVGLVFSVGLVATLVGAVGRRASPGIAEVLCLPFICSLYVISSGARLLPDNAGWWGALAILLIALRRRVDMWTYVGGVVVLLALVLVRQIHLWAAAALVVAGWLGPEREEDVGREQGRDVGRASARRPRDRQEAGEIRCAEAHPTFIPEPVPAHFLVPPAVVRLAWTAVAILPSLAVLVYFFHHWDGTLPPNPAVRRLNAGANPAVPAMALAVFGTVGVFFAGFLLPHRATVRRAWPAVVAGAVVGTAAGLIVPTDYDMAAGRWSGLWNLARHLPTVAHRSPLVAGLAALGGAMLAAWWAALPRRDGWVFVTAWVAFAAAHTATHEAFQRYYEPWALALLAVGASRLGSAGTSDSNIRWAAAGPLLLAGLLAAITFMSR